MATATQKAAAATGANGGAAVSSDSVAMEFLIDEDNGGEYYWALLGPDGTSLARSPSYASYEQAEDAARVVLTGAGSARLDRRDVSSTSDRGSAPSKRSPT